MVLVLRSPGHVDRQQTSLPIVGNEHHLKTQQGCPKSRGKWLNDLWRTQQAWLIYNWYLLLWLDHASSCYQTSASGLTRGPFKNITYICDISSSLKLSHINHHTSMIQNTWAMLKLEWIGVFQKSPARTDHHLSPFGHPIHRYIKHHRNSQNHQQITKTIYNISITSL